MKQYKIYVSSTGSTEAVKQGWSWPAFFFNGIWAFVKKIWGKGVAFFGFFFGLGLILASAGTDDSTSTAIVNLLSIGLAVLYGAKGNSWRESNLESRGYKHAGTVSAANAEGAIALQATTS